MTVSTTVAESTSTATTSHNPTPPGLAFVNFPSPFAQSLIEEALSSVLPDIRISCELGPVTPRLQWADYDLMSFDEARHDPRYLISSYIYRKALIRKHLLHNTATEYLAKCRHRGVSSALALPRGWVLDIQFADELDEALMDDLYDLAAAMRANETRKEREWFILKPGFADKGQGIRLFSTADELRAIFEEFEPPSDDEGEDGEGGEDGEEDEVHQDAGATAVLTQHLRQFVIQEYMPRPMLFDVTPSGLVGHKVHLRAHVLVTGAWEVYLSHALFVLFAGVRYTPPRSDDLDLRPHLTNVCIQTGQAPGQVLHFWAMGGATALAHTPTGYVATGTIDDAWLEATFAKTGAVIAEAVRAAAECGSFNLQLMENAFELFGVDLLLSHPHPHPHPDLACARDDAAPPVPDVTLLEFNASPDVVNSGDALRPNLVEMFEGIVRIGVVPFFGRGENAMALGEDRWGWRKVGKGEVRGWA
ncbi:hypothetical protein CC85DRAFT_309024 [Cutaneotrichosporon oleaginosum]|uniref:TTL-domain-containing protein n=1 Tax=Cutaneotrichosporon oleaginosum TaxID=879819 RepID=A0A0J1AYN9_9TREE|nr:uncharacterized protein CC85DRAFT_309024 [Cutaneotrichosporon oleaginosum]KLT40429.1 hypothetical protein CC85DRAFT_309024 [Cutaneotrichosporon oleaginosum]TXT11394.1 hypothetical protein COLE_01804 [Cutaneotrichosporon oleaginosum]